MLRSLRFASMSSALSASAVLAALAPCLPCHATEVPQAAPVPPVQVVESTPATLVLDVKIEGAGPKRLEFTRPNATASWKLATPLAEDAVVGSDRLPFVDPKALRLRGGKPEDALRLLTPAIGGTKGDRASIVNLFLASSALMFAISVIGVLLFAALTAYDTQNIKNTYLEHAQASDSDWLGKAAIMGALQLYLDFINMFMFMLNFTGNSE